MAADVQIRCLSLVSLVADISEAKPLAVTRDFLIHVSQTVIYRPGPTSDALTVSVSPTLC